MSTLAHRTLPHGTTPPLRLLERRPARQAAAVRAPSQTLAQRLERWLAALPEPAAHHRLGSWTDLR